MIFTRLDTPVGRLTLVAGDPGLRAVLFEGEALPPAAVEGPHPLLVSAEEQLREYFAGDRGAFELPLELVGTPFQQRVWLALRSISYGTTISYGEQACRLGHPRAARAVGAANARNPVSIVLPCHRVVGADGALTGYGGGLDAKRLLLEHEARVLARSGPASSHALGALLAAPLPSTGGIPLAALVVAVLLGTPAAVALGFRALDVDGTRRPAGRADV